MGAVSDRLRAKAAVRTVEVDVDGEKFMVREVSSSTFAKYGELMKAGQRTDATAIMLEECVLDDEGNQALQPDDAKYIAGSTRVVIPLISAILDLSGLGKDDEKKADAG